nr:cytochrome b6/f complex subunit V [Clematis tubulosa var. ichangensis]
MTILNRVRSNSYYFGWIIRNFIFTIQTRRSVGPLIK